MDSDRPSDRAAYFDALYRKDADPWRYVTCDYEIDKRRDTLAALRPRYASACEVGCSIGVLTAELAARCDRLIGIDVSAEAVASARVRLAGFPNVEIRQAHLPHDEPAETFDLLVLSEMLYFLTGEEIDALAALGARRVEPGGEVLIVNYDGETQTHLNGRASSDRFLGAAAQDFDLLRSEQRAEYHLHLLRRRGDR